MDYINIKVDKSKVPDQLENNTDKYVDQIEEMLNTYIAKNIDYGNSFSELYNDYGLLSTVIRLSDKLNRLKRLQKADAEVEESVEDTLQDLANYAIMTLIEEG